MLTDLQLTLAHDRVIDHVQSNSNEICIRAVVFQGLKGAIGREAWLRMSEVEAMEIAAQLLSILPCRARDQSLVEMNLRLLKKYDIKREQEDVRV